MNIHTHARTGDGIEMVSVMAGQDVALPQSPFSIGVHPWQVDRVDVDAALREIETAPASAIGETGLDYAVSGDRELQKTVFRAQLRIAEERGLPVVLHCVRAFEPTMEILAKYRLPAVVFHGFVGSHEQALRAVERTGYYLSLGERSLSSPKTVEAMRVEALKRVPLESLFLETDESRLSIAEIYFRTSEIIGMPVAELAHKIYDNYMTVFGR